MRKNITAFEKESAHGLFLATGIHGESIKSFTVGFIFQSKHFLGLSKNALHEKGRSKIALLQACKVSHSQFLGWVKPQVWVGAKIWGAFPR
jgi:hypothetical protein